MQRPGLPRRSGDPRQPPSAEGRQPNTALPQKRQTGGAQRFALPKPAQGSLFTTKSWEFGSAYAGGRELEVRQARAREERAGIPRERLREMTAQPWTTQEPACKKSTHLQDALRKPRDQPRPRTPKGHGGPRRGSGHTPAPHGPTGTATDKLVALELSHACTKSPGPARVK